MIIQIRGTSGSGKTTVMRRLIHSIDALSRWEKEYVDGRQKPETYKHGRFYVCGHYEATCGGCDNIGSAAQVFNLYQRILDNWNGSVEPILLSEGLLLSEDVKWTSRLESIRVLFLSTNVEECIRRVKKRRADAGNLKPLSESNTRNRVATIERARKRLIDAGVYCRRSSYEQALGILRGWINAI